MHVRLVVQFCLLQCYLLQMWLGQLAVELKGAECLAEINVCVSAT